jgi:ADP-ribose pyrophosphatase YjhB (NUDIX family)
MGTSFQWRIGVRKPLGTRYQFGEFVIVFLVKEFPPREILVLLRDEHKEFAPNLCTGIGGLIETGESADEAAYRELHEESGIASENVQLSRFATITINTERRLHYYVGRYEGPAPGICVDGLIFWAQIEEVEQISWIPITEKLVKSWLEHLQGCISERGLECIESCFWQGVFHHSNGADDAHATDIVGELLCINRMEA